MISCKKMEVLPLGFSMEEKKTGEAKREVLDSIPAVNMGLSNSLVEAFNDLYDIINKSVAQTGFRDLGKLSEKEDAKEILVVNCQVQGGVTIQEVEDLEKEDSSQITYTETFHSPW